MKISRYKNLFAKGYTPNWCEENYVVKNVTVPWTDVVRNCWNVLGQVDTIIHSIAGFSGRNVKVDWIYLYMQQKLI